MKPAPKKHLLGPSSHSASQGPDEHGEREQTVHEKTDSAGSCTGPAQKAAQARLTKGPGQFLTSHCGPGRPQPRTSG